MKHLITTLQRKHFSVRKQFLQFFQQNRTRYEFGFILGHMRSGSTLLLHILASNPGILAGGERNKTYRSVKALESLKLDICAEQNQIPQPGTIIFDQINHARMTPSMEVLDHPHLTRLFLIRQPVTTMASLVNTFEPIYGNWDVERAARYYIDRVSNLMELATNVANPKHSFLIRYEELIDKSLDSLGHLQKFLSLPIALTPEYQLQEYTGKRGDPSPRIKAGEILPDRVVTDFDIPDHLLKETTEVYEQCIEVIGQFSA